jgi:CubicO group peptidase (beta-lactamase class C family)
MKNKIIVLFFSLLFIVNSSFGQSNSLDTLDKYIPELMQYFCAPGLAISIVQDGEIKYSKGFGTKTINKDDPVDSNTLFAIGSISKSFTAMALAMLVDEGKIGWDDKVTKYVPYFQLYDPYVTSSFTIRDLLTHRSGLKEVSGGTLWYHSDLNREEVIRGLKYLEPVSEFRTKAAYQNTMFLVASKVIEAVTGGSWDDFIRRRIFKPLGMVNTVISQAERRVSQNISSPHIKNEEFEIITIEQEKMDNLAPAGSIYSSANDMARYINFLLNNGINGNDTIISRSVFNEIFKPQFHFQSFGEPIHNEFTSYGFGWWLTPKNGNKIVDHSGGVDGMVANLIMIKNKNFGVIVLTNSSAAGWAAFSLTFDIIGSFLEDIDYKNVSSYLKSNFLKTDSIQGEKRKRIQNSRILNTWPSLTMEKYAGTFNDEMYGDISIVYENKKLRITFSHTPLFTGVLTHWHYDTFKIDWEDPRVPDGFITFEFNSDGAISGFKLNQPDLLDVDFTELKIKKKI